MHSHATRNSLFRYSRVDFESISPELLATSRSFERSYADLERTKEPKKGVRKEEKRTYRSAKVIHRGTNVEAKRRTGVRDHNNFFPGAFGTVSQNTSIILGSLRMDFGLSSRAFLSRQHGRIPVTRFSPRAPITDGARLPTRLSERIPERPTNWRA